MGSVLRRLRIRAGLSQEELAERAGVSASAVPGSLFDPLFSEAIVQDAFLHLLQKHRSINRYHKLPLENYIVRVGTGPMNLAALASRWAVQTTGRSDGSGWLTGQLWFRLASGSQ